MSAAAGLNSPRGRGERGGTAEESRDLAWPWRLAAWIGLAAYFWYFARYSVSVRFAPDDLMNLDYYWRLPPLHLLFGYRPMGAAFYLPLLRIFGLDPAPFHVVMMLLLAVNVYLVYRFAKVLGSGEIAAFGAAFLACYHAGLSFLFFNTSFVYDAMCSVFFLSAFVYYAERRASGEAPRAGVVVATLGLYWLSINSKEMGLTFPAALLIYEWMYQERRSYRTAVIAAILGIPVALRTLIGPDALIGIVDYRPEFSIARVMAFQREAFSDLFESWHFFTTQWTIAVWVLITAAAWWPGPRIRARRFCWWWFVITPGPIMFLEGRTNACLIIPFCGLAVLAAIVFTEAASAVSVRLPWARLRRAAMAGMLAFAAYLWGFQNARLQHHLIAPQMRALGQDTWSVIRDLRALHPGLRPHSTVVFLNDPFEGFDMAFIADLCFLRRDVNIRLNRKTPMGAAEIAKADYLFDYRDGRLTRVR